MSRTSGFPYFETTSISPTMEVKLSTAESLVWTWQQTLLSIPLGLIVIGTIFGNFLVLYAAVTKSHTLRLPTHYIIANLAIADFLVGVLVMPFLATIQVTGGRWYFGSTYCEAWTVIHFWLCSSSILSTCAVCIERYIGVRYPHSHSSIMNPNRIWGIILCVWVIAGLLAFGSLYIWPAPKSTDPMVCPINQEIGHVLMAVVGILYVPAAIMIILYGKIYWIATKRMKLMQKKSTHGPSPSDASSKSFTSVFRKKPKSSTVAIDDEESTTEISVTTSTSQGNSEDLEKGGHQQTNASTSKPASSSTTPNTALVRNESNKRTKKQINLAKRLSILVGVLLASYLPFFTVYMYMAFHPGSIPIPLFMFLGWIRYFNSCINPVIYAWAVPAYRVAMLDTIRKVVGYRPTSARK